MKKIIRIVWFSGGIMAVVLGSIGALVPILPTVPFLLLALFCFARSYPKWRDKILQNRIIGQPLREYLQYNGIRKSVKIYTIAFLWTSILISVIFMITILWVRLLLLVISVAISIHILSFKTIKK